MKCGECKRINKRQMGVVNEQWNGCNMWKWNKNELFQCHCDGEMQWSLSMEND